MTKKIITKNIILPLSKDITTSTKNRLIFITLLVILVVDKIITLKYFGFIYTDLDQTVIWNGAIDYAQGIFREPFFYGQPYNYMLESLLSVPLLWIGIPIYIAMPIVTSIISIAPFIVLAYIFYKKESYFWAYLSLVLPVLLPQEYNFLTTLPRGFIQAHVFIPLLFIPLLNPNNKRNISILYLASALSFISNQSSTIIIVPIFIYVFLHQYKAREFYIKSTFVLPILLIDYLAKYHYKIHPEKVQHYITGLETNWQTLLDSLTRINHFEYLFPFFPNWGIIYPFIFITLLIIAYKKGMKKEFLSIISILILLIVTFSIPKVQTLYNNAGIFFTISRLYLYLPLLIITTLYLVFRKIRFPRWTIYLMLTICSITFYTKNNEIQKKVEITVNETKFPVIKVQKLLERHTNLEQIINKHNIDIVVHPEKTSWQNIFDSFSFHPLNYNHDSYKDIVLVALNKDRRTWIYSSNKIYNQILLAGFKIDKPLLDKFDYEIINKNYIVISNNKLPINEFFNRLNLKFGDKK